MLGHLIFIISAKRQHIISHFSRNFVNRTLLNTWNSATIVRPFLGATHPTFNSVYKTRRRDIKIIKKRKIQNSIFHIASIQMHIAQEISSIYIAEH